MQAEDLFERVMAKATVDVPNEANPLKRFHVSQTADQLPDIKMRNALYRAELERQILEKKEMERKRREYELDQDDRLTRKIELEREKLRREFLEDEHRRKFQVNTGLLPSTASSLSKTDFGLRLHSDQDEVRKRQAAIAQRLREIQEEEERKKLEEQAKRKKMYLEHLYSNPHASTSLTAYYRTRPWNSRSYVNSALNLSLEEMYKNAPLHMLADVYKKLEYEKIKMKDIIRRRISEGEQ